ncbi:MAG: GNAT family N-acetyltransferase [Bacteroidota bacterium]
MRVLCQNDYTEAQIKVWTASIKDENRWLSFIENDYFILAHQGDQLIGFASLTNSHYLNLLYVHPQFVRKGIATQLLNAIRQQANHLEHYKLSTHASRTARPFFERNGFVVTQENRKLVNGVELINFDMREL